MENICHINANQKKMEVVILISEKVNLRKSRENYQWLHMHYLMIKVDHQEDITILKVNATNSSFKMHKQKPDKT